MIRSQFINMLNFRGRIRRRDFWRFAVLDFVLIVVSLYLLSMILTSAVFVEHKHPLILFLTMYVSCVLCACPAVALVSAAVRRFHDVGCSGLVLLIWFVPFVGFVATSIILLIDSGKQRNRYGPSPKYVSKASDALEEFGN